MSELPHLARADGVEAVCAALESAGACIINDALTAAQREALDHDLAPWFDAAPCGEGPFFGTRTRRFSALFAKAPRTAMLALDDVVLPVAEAMLGAGTRACDRIQLNLTQAIGIGPGEPAQHLHRDDDFFPFAHAGAELMINALWTLDPFTAANGATRIAPGSHRWDRKRPACNEDLVAAEAPKGAVILWLGSALHGGGANTTNALRRGVVMSYSVGWLAPAEKLLVSIPPDIARTFPERLQQLIGYQIHRPNLGWVEGRDPIEWLRGEIGAVAAAGDILTPAQTERLKALAAARER
ncbi:MAG: phytanoyl-CoA dioxygenase family protein [Alphaproteobacteria bacterium]|nr:phytanoyl-CoA dioxygenase family protein [Alphaproteobacteria bacterium]